MNSVVTKDTTDDIDVKDTGITEILVVILPVSQVRHFIIACAFSQCISNCSSISENDLACGKKIQFSIGKVLNSQNGFFIIYF